MTKNRNAPVQDELKRTRPRPKLDIKKIGIVSRDYGVKFENGYRDFSHTLPEVLRFLDDNGCDTILFSLFSIIPREGYNLSGAFSGLKNVKAILLEEFQDGESRKAGRYVIYHRSLSGWEEYDLHQAFGTVNGMSQEKLDFFMRNEMPKRVLGNCCVLLCGETNGVKYSKGDKKIHDTFGLRGYIPQSANVVLNPIHDRMNRFEMKLKRKFLSENNRWMISVWNKGRKDKNAKVRDGGGPAWTLYHNGDETQIDVRKEFGVEIGILDINEA